MNFYFKIHCVQLRSKISLYTSSTKLTLFKIILTLFRPLHYMKNTFTITKSSCLILFISIVTKKFLLQEELVVGSFNCSTVLNYKINN